MTGDVLARFLRHFAQQGGVFVVVTGDVGITLEPVAVDHASASVRQRKKAHPSMRCAPCDCGIRKRSCRPQHLTTRILREPGPRPVVGCPVNPCGCVG
jgi:hypothetical protein